MIPKRIEKLRDSEFKSAFNNTNFGTKDYDSLVLEALEKTATGYYNGYTMKIILEKLSLIDFREGGTVVVLSDYGLQKMYELKAKS